ncbi:putative titin-like [Capsicum annuum]|nr:putative titin-like [Capsicum annuum]
MGCDKAENLPNPTSVHAVGDDLSLSIRQSVAADYNGVIQGGFSSGANVTSFPFVSSQGGLSSGANVTSFPFVSSDGGFTSGANATSFPFVSSPAVHPLPGNVNEMNNFEMVDLMNLNTLHHHHLEPKLMNDRSNLRFSGKEVSNKLEEAGLPQSNKSPGQQVRRNFPSVIHGVSGGITNFQHDMGGLPNSARNSGVLAPGSRISAPPFMYVTPDARLNSSNTRNSGAVGKADLRLAEPDPLKYVQGGVPPPPLPFSSNSTLPPYLGFGRMAAAPESAHAAQSTINLQNNLYANISRNQSFMGSPILTHGGGNRVRQDHLGQQSFVNVPYPWGNNLFPEGMGAQIAGWSGIQPAPGNQFPKRLGVQLNDGAISQATREGVLPGMGGIQQIGRGNSYQSQDYGPKMQPTELSHPPFAMGRPQGGSPAKFNVSGFPYHAGQGIPISKADGTPQASYIPGHTSVKRKASRAPPTPPTCQRRRTLTQHSNQQLIAQQRQITNSPVPASSPSLPSSLVKRQAGLEELPQPVGVKCHLCKRDVAFNPEGPISRPAAPPPVAVLPCGHAFHDHCLELITPKEQSKEPPCIPCALGET